MPSPPPEHPIILLKFNCYYMTAVSVKRSIIQGPRSKFSSGGAKEEYVKETFGGGGGGSMLVDFYTISLK